MARTDSLANFLTDIANSIREKTGSTATISPIQFDNAIEDMPSGEGDEAMAASYMSCIDGTLGANCTKLPNGVTTIGKQAFYQQTGLALTELPETITSIGDSAFEGCTNLALTNLPSGLTSIGLKAFHNCGNLALSSIPDSVTSIGGSAFYYCTKLALSELPKAIAKEIPNSCFTGCTGLRIRQIPDTVENIGAYAFFGTYCLTNTIFSANLKNINYEGLRSCSYNKTFVFLGDCTSLSFSDSALTHNSGLEDVIFPNAVAVPKCGRNILGGSRLGNLGIGHIYVPDALVDSFKAAGGWNTYANYILPLSEYTGEVTW